MPQSEFQLQSQCFLWHWNNYPAERGQLFTINNNSASRKEGAVMKAMGIVAGVSDMIYLHPGGICFLEFKTETGRQSDSQKRFQQVVESLGFQYSIIRNFNDFKNAIRK